MYTIAIRSLYRHFVCNGPVSCKANRVGNQLGAWRYSDPLAVEYNVFYFFGKSESNSNRTKLESNSKMTDKHAAEYINYVYLGVN